MVLECCTGYSGSFARQVTLNRAAVEDDLTCDLLAALKLSAAEGAIVLEGEGMFLDGLTPTPAALQFGGHFIGGAYVMKDGKQDSFSREELISLAAAGRFVATFTARHGTRGDVDNPQPAIWTLGPIERQSGRQEFPVLDKTNHSMTISGRHVREGAKVIVDGRLVLGSVTLLGEEKIQIELSALPPAGMHIVQLQNPGGLFSNDFILNVGDDTGAAAGS